MGTATPTLLQQQAPLAGHPLRPPVPGAAMGLSLERVLGPASCPCSSSLQGRTDSLGTGSLAGSRSSPTCAPGSGGLGWVPGRFSPRMLRLQRGQVCCSRSQGSTQSRWNSWEQGSTRSHCQQGSEGTCEHSCMAGTQPRPWQGHPGPGQQPEAWPGVGSSPTWLLWNWSRHTAQLSISQARLRGGFPGWYRRVFSADSRRRMCCFRSSCGGRGEGQSPPQTPGTVHSRDIPTFPPRRPAPTGPAATGAGPAP